MRVLVTGGTGFVGSHTAAALLGRGHEVRLLARSRQRVAAALGMHGLDVSAVEVADGDMTDAGAVAEAVSECQAVVHVAAVYSYDPRDAATMLSTNERGTRVVLEAGASAGASRLVHVSSIVSLCIRRPGTRVTADAPPGDLTGAYARSKRASDEVAVRLQREGAPVVRMMPAAVIGPTDPADGETNLSIRNILRGTPPLFASDKAAYCDVRDCAAVLASLAEGLGDRPAWLPPLSDVNAVDVLREVTGRRLPVLRMPSRLVYTMSAPAEWAVKPLPRSVPALQRGGVELFAGDNRFDDEGRFAELGVSRTPAHDSFRDTVRWLAATGAISAKQAGTAA